MDERDAVVWAVLQNKQLAEELDRIKAERDLYRSWWQQAIQKEAEQNVCGVQTGTM